MVQAHDATFPIHQLLLLLRDIDKVKIKDRIPQRKVGVLNTSETVH